MIADYFIVQNVNISKKKTVESVKEEPEEDNSELLVMGEDDMKQAKRTRINYKD